MSHAPNLPEPAPGIFPVVAPALGPEPAEVAVAPIAWRKLFAGVPAVVIAAIFLAFLAVAVSDARLALDYKRSAQRALFRKEYDTALVCFKRLVALNSDKDEDRYALVLLLDQIGKPERAEAIARSIAPVDRTGYGPAHYWQARRIVDDPARLARSAPLVEGHLIRFLKGTPDSIEAKGLLGALYVSQRRFREARPFLEAATTDEPEKLIELGRVCETLGDKEVAANYVKEALKSAKTRAEGRTDDRQAWLQWASVVAQTGDFREALAILERGFAMSQDPTFRKAQAAVCIALAQQMERDPKSTPGDRFTLIAQGLAFDPENTRLVEETSRLLAAGGETAEKARAALREQLAAGRTPALVHFLLGSDDWANDRVEAARTHWEQAYRIDPGYAVVANNLAWMLAFREPTDVPRALALIDDALARNPGDARFRATRGQILTRAGRWKDALTDLEAALAAGQDTPSLHDALAQTYEHLGMPEMAVPHRKPR